MDIHAIGDFLLHASIACAFFSGLSSLLGKLKNNGRLLLAGEQAGYALSAMVICASFLLISAFCHMIIITNMWHIIQIIACLGIISLLLFGVVKLGH